MTVTLIHTGDSWWWHQHRCEIKCSDGRKVDPRDHFPPNNGMTWEIHETHEGIEASFFNLSSGQGKQLAYKKLLIPKSEYTQVKHKGKEPKRPSAKVFAFMKRETGW